MLHGGDVVRNFLHVFDGDVRYLIVLKQEQVGERGLSAFDLRGDRTTCLTGPSLLPGNSGHLRQDREIQPFKPRTDVFEGYSEF